MKKTKFDREFEGFVVGALNTAFVSRKRKHTCLQSLINLFGERYMPTLKPEERKIFSELWKKVRVKRDYERMVKVERPEWHTVFIVLTCARDLARKPSYTKLKLLQFLADEFTKLIVRETSRPASEIGIKPSLARFRVSSHTGRNKTK